ncbi:MAG: cytochrome c oxidase assembly protein [Acidimicrobiia bacterium]
MLSALAHQGSGAHTGLWSHWSTDPLVLVGLGVVALTYQRGSHGRRRPSPGRVRSLWLGLLAVAVALVSPLDALAGDLASAHMVQHVLLVVVAAPLLVLSAPIAHLIGGSPPALRSWLRRAHRAARRSPVLEQLRRPGVAWFLHAGTLWFWHAAVPYGGALEHDAIHAGEHATFLVTALFFWSSVLRAGAARRVSEGYAALLVFTMAMQGVFLGALLTFASSAWYDGYRETTAAWGLDPVADQQLAGVIMWVPAGFVYVAAGIALVARWSRVTGGAGTGHPADDWSGGGLPERARVSRVR